MPQVRAAEDDIPAPDGIRDSTTMSAPPKRVAGRHEAPHGAGGIHGPAVDVAGLDAGAERDLRRAGEVGPQVDGLVVARPHLDRQGAVDRHRQHGAAVVVEVLADQVHSAGHIPPAYVSHARDPTTCDWGWQNAVHAR